MPRGNRTGPVGIGGGRMGGMRRGPSGYCVCPSCGTVVPHKRGVPCYQMVCPKCGTRLRRQ
ncbi:MAG: hypothetical protein ACPL28_12340 [bacterium]